MMLKSGIVSNVLVVVGVVFGALGMGDRHMGLAFVYLGCSLLAALLIIYTYCRKCPHSANGSCHRIFPGRVAKSMPYKKTGKYTALEMGLIIVALMVVVVPPVFFMQAGVLVGYGVLWAGVVLLQRGRVCGGCYNRWCVICPNRVT